MGSGEVITDAATKHDTCTYMVTSAASICMHHEAFVINTFFNLHYTFKMYNTVYACIHELACMTSKVIKNVLQLRPKALARNDS